MQFLVGIALGGEMLEGVVPTVGGVTQAEGLDGGGGQVALIQQIFAGKIAGGGGQVMSVKEDSLFQ